ncbi:putative inorganic phosphate transporter, partial [Pelagophyceae sp. CCMP2097]
RAGWKKADWTWLLVIAAILALVAAFGIGANDVANAFSSSVGAKTLTMRQAVVIASIFEFLGALLMGNKVSETIRKAPGIADVECFEDNPGLLMYGMTVVIFSMGLWLLLACHLELAVSTTHSVVGGIIGMTMMSKGVHCVIWNHPAKAYDRGDGHNGVSMAFDNFPYLDGVAEIVASWILSPIAAGIVAAVIYGLTRVLILDRHESYRNVKIAFPVIVGFTIAVNVVFFIIKGTAGRDRRFHTRGMVREAKDGDVSRAVTVGAIVGAACAGVVAALGMAHEAPDEEADALANTEAGARLALGDDAGDAAPPKKATRADRFAGYVTRRLDEDPYSVVTHDVAVGEMHARLRRHDTKTEHFFKYVQVFTACVAAFSHGANDVANAMGPFAATYTAWQRGAVNGEADLKDNMTWILAIGGTGIVFGIVLYGYKIMRVLGVKLCALTPARGFAVELGAAFVIIYGTSQGCPLSTTHCQVGAIVAVGMFEGRGGAGINAKLLLRTVGGWIMTIIFVGGLAALLVGPAPEPLKDEYC